METTGELKTCTKCGETKSLDDFSRGAAYADGYRAQCKRCVCVYSKVWASANRPKLAAQARIRRQRKPGRNSRPQPNPNATAKQCRRCQTEKPVEDFPFARRQPNQRASVCKACEQLQKKAWRNRNKDKVNARTRARSKSDKVKAQTRERRWRWRKQHPEQKKAENIRYRENLNRRKMSTAGEQQANESSRGFAGPS